VVRLEAMRSYGVNKVSDKEVKEVKYTPPRQGSPLVSTRVSIDLWGQLGT